MSGKKLQLDESLDSFNFSDKLSKLLENSKKTTTEKVAATEKQAEQVATEIEAATVLFATDTEAATVMHTTETVAATVTHTTEIEATTEKQAATETEVTTETEAYITVATTETEAHKKVATTETVAAGTEITSNQIQEIILKILPMKDITYICKDILILLLIKQKRDIVQLNYRKVQADLGIHASGIARALLTLNTVPEIEQFKIKNELFISFKKMTTTETVASSSSSYINNNTTNRRSIFGNEKFFFTVSAALLLHKLDNDYINKQIIEALQELEVIEILQLFHYIERMKPTNKISYIIKAIKDKWYIAMSDKEIKELEEKLSTVKKLEGEKLNDLGRKEILEYLKTLKITSYNANEEIETLRTALELFVKQLRTLTQEIKKLIQEEKR